MNFSLPTLTGTIAFVVLVIDIITIWRVLNSKREPTSTIAWCLLVLLIPFFGFLIFYLFGRNTIAKPIGEKRRKSLSYRSLRKGRQAVNPENTEIVRLAAKVGASPLIAGNSIALYHDGQTAFEAMIEAISAAKHHIHLEMFIFRNDRLGNQFVDLLIEKAKAGVEVRFLYDAIGSWKLQRKTIRDLKLSGVKVSPFLTLLNPLWRRFQINLRNHRKILVVDGQIGFTGGFNIGTEYLGESSFFGNWRDTLIEVRGPGVRSMQELFAEDWDFACGERLEAEKYFQSTNSGTHAVQLAWSGPDQEIKAIREIYLAAMMQAKSRIWLVTPYFVPDTALMDALIIAARMGRDVRIVLPFRPDKWVPLLASRYYWSTLLSAGVQIYQYTAGFIHAKYLLVDDSWASVGSANFDNRSMFLNFEVTAILHHQDLIAPLSEQFLKDCELSIHLQADTFAQRPLISKMAENACRLLSPIL
ncbi:MAG: cardiolipin synthase [Zavarzinella sp.]